MLITSFLTRSPDLYQWGTNEVGTVARALVLTHGFSSPYHDASGPTAWLAPVYPAIASAIFLFLGVQTPASAIAVIIFNALCSSLVTVVLYKMGAEFFSERVGMTAGLLWAVAPSVALITLMVWDTCLSTLMTACACWLTLRLVFGEKQPAWRHVAAGSLWGLAGLSSPVVLAPLPFLVLWLWSKDKQVKAPALFAASAGMVLVPWTVRNFLAFHKLVPVRDNFWAEVYWGNLGFGTHPLGNSMGYQTLGEMPFIEVLKQRVLDYIHYHFAEFARQTLDRAEQFWIRPEGMWGLSFFLALVTALGLLLMARRRHPAAFPFFIILMTFPVTYYISYAFSRYRHPIEPIMYLSSAFFLVEASQTLGRTKRSTKAESK